MLPWILVIRMFSHVMSCWSHALWPNGMLHFADYNGEVPQLDKEKAALGSVTEELCDALVAKRREGIERARQMERDRTFHSLHVLVSAHGAVCGGGKGVVKDGGGLSSVLLRPD